MDEPAENIIRRAGIHTIRDHERGEVFWKYGDVVIPRPRVTNWEQTAKQVFNITIQYRKSKKSNP